MKAIVFLVKLIFFAVFLALSGYLLLPTPSFPQHPPFFLVSHEPADLETPLRRGYYTDTPREEIMNHYKNALCCITVFGFNLKMPTLRLNYPPEEAKVLIRDLTKSTFLEELVHPLRESVFINGFEPKDDKDNITFQGKKYRQKVTVRYVPSSPLLRVLIPLIALGALFIILREWAVSIKQFFKDWFGQIS